MKPFCPAFSVAILLLVSLPSWSQDTLDYAQSVIGLEFSKIEQDSMKSDLADYLKDYQQLRNLAPTNDVPPALGFNPIPLGFEFEKQQQPIDWQMPDQVKLPKNREALAYYPLKQLAYLLKNRKVTSIELTRIYLDRLKRYGDTLQCVVTLTEDLALKQAAQADQEIAAGQYRGPLHGIPYGVKDLLAVEGYKTTWGAAPYKEQALAPTATVVKKLEAAGAVLLGKLTMGALAWGDVWYGGVTKNPWNLEQGSSGSSAGSASATSAGLVGFSIGTETLGSIVSPSTRCGVTGLRPTYGRVSRFGAMALSWSMDKIGPICRSAEDCALVFDVIRGADGKDQTVVEAPFNYQEDLPLSSLKIGYFNELFEADYGNKANDQKSLEVLRSLGAELIPLALPDSLPVQAMGFILSAEAAAAFDQITRNNRDTLLVRQIKNAWPNVFRGARFIPAVEYIQANRLRYQLVQQMHQLMQSFDVVVTPSFGGSQLLITNLTGHPCVVAPNGFNDAGGPTSISFLGNLFDEATILAVAAAYQKATDFDELHPAMFIPN